MRFKNLLFSADNYAELLGAGGDNDISLVAQSKFSSTLHLKRIIIGRFSEESSVDKVLSINYWQDVYNYSRQNTSWEEVGGELWVEGGMSGAWILCWRKQEKNAYGEFFFLVIIAQLIVH